VLDAPLDPATVEKRTKTSVRVPTWLKTFARAYRDRSFVTSKWPPAPEPTAWTTRAGMRSRLPSQLLDEVLVLEQDWAVRARGL